MKLVEERWLLFVCLLHDVAFKFKSNHEWVLKIITRKTCHFLFIFLYRFFRVFICSRIEQTTKIHVMWCKSKCWPDNEIYAEWSHEHHFGLACKYLMAGNKKYWHLFISYEIEFWEEEGRETKLTRSNQNVSFAEKNTQTHTRTFTWHGYGFLTIFSFLS